MYLINTETLELKSFIFNKDIPFYIALSHTWGDEELTFMDWNLITKHPGSAEAAELKLKGGYKKIRDFSAKAKQHRFCPHLIKNCWNAECQVAKPTGWDPTNHSGNNPLCCAKVMLTREKRLMQCSCGGLACDWAWVDTVCIDKSSSAELQENINSMYRIYQASVACYAYLSDVYLSVAFAQLTLDMRNEFSASRWFTRGWTLQELIAPKKVLFYNNSWGLIGDKKTLADIIESCTRIPQRTLQGELRYPIPLEETRLHTGEENWHSYMTYRTSIAQMFSWVANRETAREEDISYCLLGLFNVQLPLLYGEGSRKAFRRLQDEIMKQSTDLSLFAWSHEFEAQKAGLLADHPKNFAHCSNFVLDLTIKERGKSELLTALEREPIEFSARRMTIRTLKIKDKIRGINTELLVLNCFERNDRSRLLAITVIKRRDGVFERPYHNGVRDVPLHQAESIFLRRRRTFRHGLLSITCLTE